MPSVFNKSLKTGILPREWKLANFVPIHKKGDKDHVKTIGQPISLLSLVSKVLERCVFICIKEHAFSQTILAHMASFPEIHA
jgi:hypothetical protein